MEKEKIQNFTDLFAWRESHVVILSIYKVTKMFPSDERFGLIAQIRRASVSITSNIAEGFGRRTSKDKIHFYDMAIGSLNEVRNQLFIARDLSYLTQETWKELEQKIITAHKLINGLIKSFP